MSTCTNCLYMDSDLSLLYSRTSDLATPCSFGSSLLDRVLALLPQTPDVNTQKASVCVSLYHSIEVLISNACSCVRDFM